MCFVDLEITYNCVPHDVLWEVLQHYGASYYRSFGPSTTKGRQIGAVSAVKRVESEGKVGDLPVDLCSNPHLRSLAVRSDRKNENVNTCCRIEFPSKGGWAQPCR